MSLLSVENLNLTLKNEDIINGLSFEINEKGVYTILSRSASARTALAAILAGINAPDSGSVLYKDTDLFEKNGKGIKAKIGYLPKKCFLYPEMTAYEALDFTGRMRGVGSDKRLRQIKEALELLELSHMSEVLVADMNNTERKRLMLANALIGNPSVIILDEPTEGAFFEDSEIICDVISMLGEKKVVLLFTEKISLANDLSDYIGIISGGEMVLWSSLDNIRETLGGDSEALSKTYVAFAYGDVGGAR